MKKKLLFPAICFMLLIYANNTLAQIFRKVLSPNDLHSTRQTTDGGYIITGRIYNGTNSYDMGLIKLNNVGDTLWAKSYNFNNGASDEGVAVRETADKGFIIGGSTNSGSITNAVLVKTDSVGNLKWNTLLQQGRIWDLDITTDMGYVVCTDKGYLIKVDITGAVTWSENIPNFTSVSVKQTYDKGYILTGYTPLGAGFLNILLIKTDSVGAIKWSKIYGDGTSNFGNSGNYVLQANDSGYVVMGSVGNGSLSRAAFFKTDKNGAISWFKLMGSGFGIAVQKTLDGGYAISTNENSLVKTDANGNVAWAKNYGPGGTTDVGQGNSIYPTADGGYMFTIANGQLFKTDANGISGCIQQTSYFTVKDTLPNTLNTLLIVTPDGSSAVSPITYTQKSEKFNSTNVVLTYPIKTVSTTGPTTFCLGDSVSVSAYDANNIDYLWNTGSSGSLLTIKQSGIYYALVSSTTGCVDTTNKINVIVTPLVTPSVSIIVNPNPTCASELVISSIATASDSGSTPSFQWYRNGSVSGSGNKYSSTNLINGDTIQCYMYSSINYKCLTNGNGEAISNQVKVIVNPLPTKPTITTSSSSLVASYNTGQWYFNGNPISGAVGNTYTPTTTGTYAFKFTDFIGCSAISDPYNFMITGIKEWRGANKVKIYPNPFSNVAVFEIDPTVNLQNAEIILFNLTGQVVKKFALTKEQTNILINRDNLSVGTYIYKLIDGSEKIASGRLTLE